MIIVHGSIVKSANSKDFDNDLGKHRFLLYDLKNKMRL